MRRAMSVRQASRPPWALQRTARRRASAPLYPLLDVGRFVHPFGLDTGRSVPQQPEQPRSLKDVLATSKRRPAAVFGVGLRTETEMVAEDELVVAPATEEGLRMEEEAVAEEEGIIVPEEEVEGVEFEPPPGPSNFNMSSETYRAARAADPESPESYWSYDMYERALDDGTTQKVKVHYCVSKNTMEHVCAQYFADEPVLGFDIEWMAFVPRGSGRRENVSVIQIASPSRIALFHIALFPEDEDLVAPAFRRIMENPDVSKVGVNILADCTRLRNNLDVNSRGVFELSHLYRMVKYLPDKNRRGMVNKRLVALAAQVEDQLGLPLFKGESVRESNWMKPLDEEQLRYSAADAYAGVHLYHVLETKRTALDPCPQRPFHAELGLPLPIPDEEDVDDGDDDVAVAVEQLDALTITSSSESESKVAAAEARMEEYRASKESGTTAKPSSLRAYYIWADDEAMTPKTIAGLLRDPPLQTSTVVTYIVDAIVSEDLAYSKERAVRDLVPTIRQQVFRGSRKYKAFIRECQDA